MTAHQKTGLMAAGIVGGLALLGTCAVGGIMLAGRDKPTAGQSRATSGRDEPGRKVEGPKEDKRIEGPASAGPKDDAVTYILGHKWWRKGLGVADVDSLIQFVIDTNAKEAVWIDSDGNRGRGGWGMNLSGGRDWWVRPDNIDKRRNICLPPEGDRRPDRAEALRRLRAALDKAEYRDGRGR